MTSSAAIPDAKLGLELIARGCRQGALLEAQARMLWLRGAEGAADTPDKWIVGEDSVNGAMLVVVSQDCDIHAAPKSEPRVEAITARWTSNKSESHTARKGNSTRLYLLADESDRSLLADARRRVHIEKRALLDAKFKTVLMDDRARGGFARWIAGRYNRPAIPNALVDAVHKPIVDALDTLVAGDSPLLKVLERVAELRFVASGSAPILLVDFIAMLDDGDELTVEEEADLIAWLEEALVFDGSPVQEIRLVFRTPQSISVSDYLRTTHLQFDHYTPEVAG